MTAQYPETIYTPRTKANQQGVVYDENETERIFAEDIKKLDDEVVAIENFLGVDGFGVNWYGYILNGFNRILSPFVSTTYYFGSIGFDIDTEYRKFIYPIISSKGFIKKICLDVWRIGTPATAETCDINLFINDSKVYTFEDVTLGYDDKIILISDDLEIGFAPEDQIYFKVTTPNWSTPPASLHIKNYIYCQNIPHV